MNFLGVIFVYSCAIVVTLAGRHRSEDETHAGDQAASSRRNVEVDADLGENTIAFSVARSSPLKGHKQKQNALGFDHVFYNWGDYFHPESGYFIVPKDGIYQFTFSGGALPHKKLSLHLMKNYYEVQTLAYDGHRKKNPHVQSQKIVVQLLTGDKVWIRLADSREYGVVGTPHGAYVTTFTGHLLRDYSDIGRDGIVFTPIQSDDSDHDVIDDVSATRAKRLATITQRRRPTRIIAFSVAKTNSVVGYDVNRTRHLPTYDGMMTYDKVFVNAGDAFNITSGLFTAPLGGLYYVSFTVGKYPKMKLSVSLVKNNNEFQVMVYDESTSSKRQMQSQSIILQLLAGDTLWLKSYTASGYAVYSNLGNYITFNGYLLQAL